jgi:signal transduction histidine kinase
MTDITAERTRLARQLHDTLLQTLQGSDSIAEHAHETVTSVLEARRILGRLKDWLTKADGEGRAVLDVLREETAEENIERALQGAIDQILPCPGIVTIRTTSDRGQSIPAFERTYFRSALRQFATRLFPPKSQR